LQTFIELYRKLLISWKAVHCVVAVCIVAMKIGWTVSVTHGLKSIKHKTGCKQKLTIVDNMTLMSIRKTAIHTGSSEC